MGGMAKKLILFLGRLLASGVFAFAALSKLPDPTATHLAVYQYRILSWETSELFALLLPWLELVAAAGLWIPRVALGACTLNAALNLLFLGAIGSALFRDLDISCGCFGASNQLGGLLPRLFEDVLLLSVNLMLMRDAVIRRQTCLNSASKPSA